MIEQHKQLVLAFLEDAYGNRTALAMARLHPEASWWVLGDPQRLRVSGLRQRAQIERLLEGVKRAMPGGMQHVVHGVIAEGDRVAVEVEARGERGDGRPYHNRYHFLFEIRDGLIVAVREYMDTLALHDFSR